MSAVTGLKKNGLLFLLVALLVSGCGIASSYRPADKKAIRDFSGNSDYRKKVGGTGAFQCYSVCQRSGGGPIHDRLSCQH